MTGAPWFSGYWISQLALTAEDQQLKICLINFAGSWITRCQSVVLCSLRLTHIILYKLIQLLTPQSICHSFLVFFKGPPKRAAAGATWLRSPDAAGSWWIATVRMDILPWSFISPDVTNQHNTAWLKVYQLPMTKELTLPGGRQTDISP